jgi:hypothetical protein
VLATYEKNVFSCSTNYMKMPETMASSFADWPGSESGRLDAAIFGLYFDQLWLQGLCAAVATLAVFGSLRISTTDEYEVTNALFNLFPQLLVDSAMKRPLSIKGLGTLLYQKRRSMERSVYSGFRQSEAELMALYPLGQIGELGRIAAPRGLPTLERAN